MAKVTASGPFKVSATVIAGMAAVTVLATSCSGTSPGTAASASHPIPQADAAALRALGHSTLRPPGSLPETHLAAGTDTLPAVAHIVVLMLENHTFDNVLGMLGRGDGYHLDANGSPTATNLFPDGRVQHAFPMPTTCQLKSMPSQEWSASHNAYDSGRNDGFVSTSIAPGLPGVGGVAMGYWSRSDLPFTYSLASVFPIADRWFSSVLGQTDPNRRFLIAGTASGMTDDIGLNPVDAPANSTLGARTPTIFNELDAHHISWNDYAYAYPLNDTALAFPATDAATAANHHPSFDQFSADAASGRLPSFSVLDPNYQTQSEENPQNMVVGEVLLADVVRAVGSSPLWRSTLLVVAYDEGGGYYDHVAPPPALAPDSVAPVVRPGESTYDGYTRYGFRVPAIVVSPYARRHYVSHFVYDHTSILALVEHKWNLPALTYRDANANDLEDFLDLPALAERQPTFPTLPTLAAAGDTRSALACSKTGPGTIPPPGSVRPAR